MSNAEDMRTLTQEIKDSYDARMGELASIRQHTSDIRQQSSDMLSEFHRMDDERKTEVSNMKKEVSGMLDGFKKEREDITSAWHSLAATMRAKRLAYATGTKESSSGEEPTIYRKKRKARKR